MRIALTDRTGDDTSNLTLTTELTEGLNLPALGSIISVVGQDGWRYIGQVIAHSDERHYTICIWTASNKILDNARLYNGGAA